MIQERNKKFPIKMKCNFEGSSFFTVNPCIKVPTSAMWLLLSAFPSLQAGLKIHKWNCIKHTLLTLILQLRHNRQTITFVGTLFKAFVFKGSPLTAADLAPV